MKPALSQSTPIHRNNDSFHIDQQVTVNHMSGTIKFIGTTEFKAGTWIGIELDKQGTGKNDGSIQGKRYFICPPKTGLFILASKLLKQQHIINRPSTPYHKLNTKLSTPSFALLPSPPTSASPISPPLPNQLEQRIQDLLLENQQLRSTMHQDHMKHEKLEKKMNQLRQTSVQSIEILEKMLQSQYVKIQTLQKEKQRYLKDIDVLESILHVQLRKEIRKHHKQTHHVVIKEEEVCSLCGQKGHDLITCNNN